MDNINKKIIFLAVALLFVGVFISGMILKAKNNSQSTFSIKPSVEKNDQIISHQKKDDGVVVESDGGVRKVQIKAGKIESASPLEEENFNDFSGLPKLGIENNRSIEQVHVLPSFDDSSAIVTIATYSANSQTSEEGEFDILDSSDYLCNVNQKQCHVTEILSQKYEGLDQKLQEKNSSFVWSDWDSTKNLIFGHLSLSDLGESSPVYVCDIQKKSCISTAGYDSSRDSDVHAVVPTGAFAPDLDKFVMVAQHDNPNMETGKLWELLLYNSEDLSKPLKTYDISIIIDSDERVAYDSVQSVSWSGDEKKLAIGTSRRIFVFDLGDGTFSLAYIAATNENGDYYWDPSSLYLTSDAGYIAFIDSPELASDEEDVEVTDEEPINILKKIDLKNNNKVTSMYSGRGLRLKL